MSFPPNDQAYAQQQVYPPGYPANGNYPPQQQYPGYGYQNPAQWRGHEGYSHPQQAGYPGANYQSQPPQQPVQSQQQRLDSATQQAAMLRMRSPSGQQQSGYPPGYYQQQQSYGGYIQQPPTVEEYSSQNKPPPSTESYSKPPSQQPSAPQGSSGPSSLQALEHFVSGPNSQPPSQQTNPQMAQQQQVQSQQGPPQMQQSQQQPPSQQMPPQSTQQMPVPQQQMSVPPSMQQAQSVPHMMSSHQQNPGQQLPPQQQTHMSGYPQGAASMPPSAMPSKPPGLSNGVADSASSGGPHSQGPPLAPSQNLPHGGAPTPAQHAAIQNMQQSYSVWQQENFNAIQQIKHLQAAYQQRTMQHAPPQILFEIQHQINIFHSQMQHAQHQMALLQHQHQQTIASLQQGSLNGSNGAPPSNGPMPPGMSGPPGTVLPKASPASVLNPSQTGPSSSGPPSAAPSSVGPPSSTGATAGGDTPVKKKRTYNKKKKPAAPTMVPGAMAPGGQPMSHQPGAMGSMPPDFGMIGQPRQSMASSTSNDPFADFMTSPPCSSVPSSDFSFAPPPGTAQSVAQPPQPPPPVVNQVSNSIAGNGNTGLFMMEDFKPQGPPSAGFMDISLVDDVLSPSISSASQSPAKTPTKKTPTKRRTSKGTPPADGSDTTPQFNPDGTPIVKTPKKSRKKSVEVIDPVTGLPVPPKKRGRKPKNSSKTSSTTSADGTSTQPVHPTMSSSSLDGIFASIIPPCTPSPPVVSSAANVPPATAAPAPSYPPGGYPHPPPNGAITSSSFTAHQPPPQNIAQPSSQPQPMGDNMLGNNPNMTPGQGPPLIGPDSVFEDITSSLGGGMPSSQHPFGVPSRPTNQQQQPMPAANQPPPPPLVELRDEFGFVIPSQSQAAVPPIPTTSTTAPSEPSTEPVSSIPPVVTDVCGDVEPTPVEHQPPPAVDVTRLSSSHATPEPPDKPPDDDDGGGTETKVKDDIPVAAPSVDDVSSLAVPMETENHKPPTPTEDVKLECDTVALPPDFGASTPGEVAPKDEEAMMVQDEPQGEVSDNEQQPPNEAVMVAPPQLLETPPVAMEAASPNSASKNDSRPSLCEERAAAYVDDHQRLAPISTPPMPTIAASPPPPAPDMAPDVPSPPSIVEETDQENLQPEQSIPVLEPAKSPVCEEKPPPLEPPVVEQEEQQMTPAELEAFLAPRKARTRPARTKPEPQQPVVIPPSEEKVAPEETYEMPPPSHVPVKATLPYKQPKNGASDPGKKRTKPPLDDEEFIEFDEDDDEDDSGDEGDGDDESYAPSISVKKSTVLDSTSGIVAEDNTPRRRGRNVSGTSDSDGKTESKPRRRRGKRVTTTSRKSKSSSQAADAGKTTFSAPSMDSLFDEESPPDEMCVEKILGARLRNKEREQAKVDAVTRRQNASSSANNKVDEEVVKACLESLLDDLVTREEESAKNTENEPATLDSVIADVARCDSPIDIKEEKKDEDAEEPDGTEEYLVKWRNYSYLHCAWKTEKELLEMDPRFGGKLKRWKIKTPTALWKPSHADFCVDPDEGDLFNQDYVEIDRILDDALTLDPSTNELLRYYLVKWRSLAYEDATWELEETLCPGAEAAIQRYKAVSRLPGPDLVKAYRDSKKRPVIPTGAARRDLSRWRQQTTSPVFKSGNTLREYQLEGLNWLSYCWHKKQNCILADEMGLGKTIQSLAFVNELVKNQGMRGPHLVIAPLSTIPNWQREFESWTDMYTVVFHGSQSSKDLIRRYELNFVEGKTPGADPFKDPNNKKLVAGPPFKFHVIITTFETCLQDQAFLSAITWQSVIIDEAHRLKNRNCKLLDGLRAFNAFHRVLLTGTPLQNNVEELFSLLHFLDPAKFSSITEFLADFGSLTTEKQVEELKNILKPMMLRRLKEDVEKSLAPKEETVIQVELTNIQKTYYRAILERNFSYLCNSQTRNSQMPSLLNIMMELRKCCNHPYLINGAESRILSDHPLDPKSGQSKLDHQNRIMISACGKLVLVDKLLAKLRADNHKVLIFSQMVRVLDILEDYLIYKGYTYERIDGRIRGSLRQESIDRFSRPDSDRFVFLLCTKAGGLGINLTAADTVIVYDSDWNPQNDLQAQARCHRIGQEKQVNVYRLVTRNTYEREMFDRASLKLGLDKAVLGSNAGTNSKSMANESSGTDSPAAPATPSSTGGLFSSAESPASTPALSKQEVEDLLKKGAYGMLMDDDTEGDAFCEEDIDKILQRRSHTIKIETIGKGSIFSKATFSTNKSNVDLSVDDPNFWQKWARKGITDEELAAQTALEEQKKTDPSIVYEPRRRRKIVRYGDHQADYTGKPAKKSKSGDGSNSDSDSAPNNDDDDSDDADVTSRRSEQRSAGIETPLSGPYFRTDVMKVTKALTTFGWARWTSIIGRLGGRRTSTNSVLASPVHVAALARGIVTEAIRTHRGDLRLAETAANLLRSWTLCSAESLRYEEHPFVPRPEGDEEAEHPEAHLENLDASAVTALKEVHFDEALAAGQFFGDEASLLYVKRNAGRLLSRLRICHAINLFCTPFIGAFESEGATISDLKIDLTRFPWFSANQDGSPTLLTPWWNEAVTSNNEGEKPPTQSSDNAPSSFCCDLSLLFGTYRHGCDAFMSIRVDPSLCFERHADATKLDAVWPSVTDLNNHIKRLALSLHRTIYSHIAQRKQAKLIAEQTRLKTLTLEAEETARKQRWTRREEADFCRTVVSYGLLKKSTPSETTDACAFSWDAFRKVSGLSRKQDITLDAYATLFTTVCQSRGGASDSVASELDRSTLGITSVGGAFKVDSIAETTAAKCLSRIRFFERIRETVASEDFASKLDAAGTPSTMPPPGMPSWWTTSFDAAYMETLASSGLVRLDAELLERFPDKFSSFAVDKDALNAPSGVANPTATPSLTDWPRGERALVSHAEGIMKAVETGSWMRANSVLGTIDAVISSVGAADSPISASPSASYAPTPDIERRAGTPQSARQSVPPIDHQNAASTENAALMEAFMSLLGSPGVVGGDESTTAALASLLAASLGPQGGAVTQQSQPVVATPPPQATVSKPKSRPSVRKSAQQKTMEALAAATPSTAPAASQSPSIQTPLAPPSSSTAALDPTSVISWLESCMGDAWWSAILEPDTRVSVKPVDGTSSSASVVGPTLAELTSWLAANPKWRVDQEHLAQLQETALKRWQNFCMAGSTPPTLPSNATPSTSSAKAPSSVIHPTPQNKPVAAAQGSSQTKGVGPSPRVPVTNRKTKQRLTGLQAPALNNICAWLRRNGDWDVDFSPVLSKATGKSTGTTFSSDLEKNVKTKLSTAGFIHRFISSTQQPSARQQPQQQPSTSHSQLDPSDLTDYLNRLLGVPSTSSLQQQANQPQLSAQTNDLAAAASWLFANNSANAATSSCSTATPAVTAPAPSASTATDMTAGLDPTTLALLASWISPANGNQPAPALQPPPTPVVQQTPATNSADDPFGFNALLLAAAMASQPGGNNSIAPPVNPQQQSSSTSQPTDDLLTAWMSSMLSGAVSTNNSMSNQQQQSILSSQPSNAGAIASSVPPPLHLSDAPIDLTKPTTNGIMPNSSSSHNHSSSTTNPPSSLPPQNKGVKKRKLDDVVANLRKSKKQTANSTPSTPPSNS